MSRTIRRLTATARTRKILSGWKGTSTTEEPTKQQCPECGAEAHDYSAALSHQTWHFSLARALRFALLSSAEGREYLAEFIGEDESLPHSDSASVSASAGGSGAGSYDSMSADPGKEGD